MIVCIVGLVLAVLGVAGMVNAGAFLTSLQAALLGSVPGLLLVLLGALIVAGGNAGNLVQPKRQELETLITAVTSQPLAAHSRELEAVIDEVSAQGVQSFAVYALVAYEQVQSS